MFGTVKRHYLKNNLILKTGFDKKRFMYNFDSQTSHSTGFFVRTKYKKKLVYMTQILSVLQIMIYFLEYF